MIYIMYTLLAGTSTNHNPLKSTYLSATRLTISQIHQKYLENIPQVIIKCTLLKV